MPTMQNFIDALKLTCWSSAFLAGGRQIVHCEFYETFIVKYEMTVSVGVLRGTSYLPLHDLLIEH